MGLLDTRIKRLEKAACMTRDDTIDENELLAAGVIREDPNESARRLLGLLRGDPGAGELEAAHQQRVEQLRSDSAVRRRVMAWRRSNTRQFEEMQAMRHMSRDELREEARKAVQP